MPRFNRLLITGAGGNLGRVLRQGLQAARHHAEAQRPGWYGGGRAERRSLPCASSATSIRSWRRSRAATRWCISALRRSSGRGRRSSSRRSRVATTFTRRRGGTGSSASSMQARSMRSAMSAARRAPTPTPSSTGRTRSTAFPSVSSRIWAKLYFDKFGIESACLRINSCFPEPADRRHLATWMSFDDLVQLVSRCLLVERVGFTVVYGISDNHEAVLLQPQGGASGLPPEGQRRGLPRGGRGQGAPGRPARPGGGIRRRRVLQFRPSGR